MICGIDEAGRGCVGGSLFVCGVAFKDDLLDSLSLLGIKDSKKLSKAQREKIAQSLHSNPKISSIIVQKTAEEIDALGLSLCLKNALEEIFASLPQIAHFIYDGNTTFKATPLPHQILQTLIKGDTLVAQISCASILAKHAKDKECEKIHQLFPHYGFNRHSGYCTPLHKAKIAEFGLTSFHRKSFRL